MAEQQQKSKQQKDQKPRVTLVSPAGKDYTTTDRVEITNLKARGYKLKK